MRIAVIGAGVVGISTAYELAADGHTVSVFDRRGSVAAEASFAPSGIIAPGWITPGFPRHWLRLFGRGQAPMRLRARLGSAQLGWLWRWSRSGRADDAAALRLQTQELATYSRRRLHALARGLPLDYERAPGCMVLLRKHDARELARVQARLAWLAETGVRHHLVTAEAARRIEPGLDPDAPLHAALYLPDGEAGNGRHFAHLLKTQTQRMGVSYALDTQVLAITPGSPAQVAWRSTHPGASRETHTQPFDAVVLCAAIGAAALLDPLGLRLPWAPVYGHSLTAPLRRVDALTELGPRGALIDERYGVSISRLGERLRISGGWEWGGAADSGDKRSTALLYQVLNEWFAGAAHTEQAQRWRSAMPVLPDGHPVLGASSLPGLWLNLGHGLCGWTLACGSARVLADTIGQRETSTSIDRLGIARLR